MPAGQQPSRGIERLIGADRVRYVRGCAIRDLSTAEIQRAVDTARRSDVAVVVVGGSSARDFDTEYLATGAAVASTRSVKDMECGEGNDRASLALLGRQEELLRADLPIELRALPIIESALSATAVSPAGVATDFYGLSHRLQKVGLAIGVLMTPDKVARKALRALFRHRKHLIPGWYNRLFIPMFKCMPAPCVRLVRNKTACFRQ